MEKISKNILALLLCAAMILPSASAVMTIVATDDDSSAQVEDEYTADLEELIAQAEAAQRFRVSVAEQDPEEVERIEARIEAAESAEEMLLSAVPTTSSKLSQRTVSAASLQFASGTGAETDPYIISSPEDLLAIADDIENGVSAYYRLDSDIDMVGNVWTPLGNATTPFTGYIDGNGHAIKNLSVSSSDLYVGLFGFAKNATIENLKLSGATVSGGSRVGALIGQASACTISNISLDGCAVTGTSYTGGLVGVTSNSTIIDCDNNGHVTNTGMYTGGLTSFMIDGKVENTVFTGTVDGTDYTGGIVGALCGDIYSCTNAGDVHGTTTVGGIAAELSYATRHKNVQYCYNSGNIEGTTEVGGIAGYSLSMVSTAYGAYVIAVANSGEVHASSSYAGGIIGDMASNTYILSAYNRGDISADSTTCGGIVGRYNFSISYTCGASSLYNIGNIKEGTRAGSVFGTSYALTVSNSHYLSEQAEGYQVPGIADNHTYSTCSVLPKTSAELKTMASTLSRFKDDTELINDGYPILTGLNYIERNTERSGREFKFGGFINSSYDTTALYYYDDDYFSQSATDYNEHLSTMSLSLALSAFASHETGYEEQYINAQNLLEDIGFTNIEVNDEFKEKPTTDSIGVITGSKKLTIDGEDVTLIAVAIRGGGYESEWASNFTIGEEGLHEGFETACDDVITYLQSYVSDQQNEISGNVKLWVTGYSRAAATANLVAGALDDGLVLDNCAYQPSDVYAYTFETPRGALTDIVNSGVYDNIFNVMNENDPVPKVAPEAWNFAWYGSANWLPSEANNGEYYSTYEEAMLERYYELGFGKDEDSEYKIDDFMEVDISFDLSYLEEGKSPVQIFDKTGTSQDAFLNTAVNKLFTESIPDRETYVALYQDDIRELFKVLNVSEAEMEKFSATFLQGLSKDLGFLILSAGLYGGLDGLPTFFEIDPHGIVMSNVVESLNENGITSYSEEDIEIFAARVLFLVSSYLKSDVVSAVTLIRNLASGSITQAHHPEICLAWVQSEDSYYTPGGAPSFSSDGYRIISVNCPVDVSVYSADGELVSSFVSDVPDVENNKVVSAVNEDGEKQVYLPADYEYSIRIDATGDGELSYSVSEYNSLVGSVTRIVDFHDISISEGDSFIADIPVWDGEMEDVYSDSVYTLADSNAQELSADIDITGEAAMQAYYTVEVASSNEEYGVVSGAGTRQLGGYAEVSAYPLEGNKFVGWYLGKKLVSSEPEYRFRVDSDIALTAKFAVDSSSPFSNPAFASVYMVDETVTGTTAQGISYSQNGKSIVLILSDDEITNLINNAKGNKVTISLSDMSEVTHVIISKNAISRFAAAKVQLVLQMSFGSGNQKVKVKELELLSSDMVTAEYIRIKTDLL